MSYTASITNKEFTNGRLKVTIQYTNGEQTFNDTMECRSPQDGDWLKKEVSRRCKELNGLEIFEKTIELGDVSTTNVEEKNVDVIESDFNKEEYKDKLNLFLKAQQAFRMEIITEENETFLELRNWLSKNFKAEYLDLFM